MLCLQAATNNATYSTSEGEHLQILAVDEMKLSPAAFFCHPNMSIVWSLVFSHQPKSGTPFFSTSGRSWWLKLVSKNTTTPPCACQVVPVPLR